MIIKSAEFVISNTEYEKCPKSSLPEYAFIGRSNVGKSSLINMITNHSNLAKTSSRPGKTQLINHFLINEEWHLVDLPGYGFARVSKMQKTKWEQFIKEYILKREQLTALVVLIDVRHTPQRIDLEFMEWLATNAIPFVMIFTKADKLKRSKIDKTVQTYKDIMLEQWEELPEMFLSSAETGKGKDQILNYIEEINNSIKSSKV